MTDLWKTVTALWVSIIIVGLLLLATVVYMNERGRPNVIMYNEPGVLVHVGYRVTSDGPLTLFDQTPKHQPLSDPGDKK